MCADVRGKSGALRGGDDLVSDTEEEEEGPGAAAMKGQLINGITAMSVTGLRSITSPSRSPELAEPVPVAVEHGPHVQLPAVGLVPLLQLLEVRVGCQSHDDGVGGVGRARGSDVTPTCAAARLKQDGAGGEEKWEDGGRGCWSDLSAPVIAHDVAPPTHSRTAWPRPLTYSVYEDQCPQQLRSTV